MNSTEKETELLLSKVDDVITLCEKRYKPCYLGFLSLNQQMIICNFIKTKGVSYLFCGGYEDSERNLLCVYPDYYEIDDIEFPILPISLKYRNIDNLSHKDFLGSFMALGISRDTIGDIVVNKGRAVAFVKNEVGAYITDNISKIGRTGVKFVEYRESDFSFEKEFLDKEYTVSSLRLDNLVSAVTGLSREKTRAIILSGDVSLNTFEITNLSKQVECNDTFSIRHYGKFVLNNTLGTTKKGRVRINVLKYV